MHDEPNCSVLNVPTRDALHLVLLSRPGRIIPLWSALAVPPALMAYKGDVRSEPMKPELLRQFAVAVPPPRWFLSQETMNFEDVVFPSFLRATAFITSPTLEDSETRTHALALRSRCQWH